MRNDLRGLTVVLAGVALVATIFAIPVPAANATAANPNGRYILSATVDQIEISPGGSIDIHFVDENGEEWVCSYGSMIEIPCLNQQVTLVMNQNETANTPWDDIIEDVLWTTEGND